MELLLYLVVLLVVTRLFGELALRAGQPALVGELVSGILLGVVAHSLSDVLPEASELTSDEVFIALTDLGVFFLMLYAGLEMHPRELMESSRDAFAVAIGGMVVPVLAGGLLAWVYIPESEARIAQIAFLGTALAITAVPVAVKVLMDFNELRTRAGRTIISAAIFDDVISLVILAVLTALIRTGELPDTSGLVLLLGRVALFFVVTVGVSLLLPVVARWLGGLWIEEFEFSALLIVAFAYGALADILGLHFILGAFIAGLFFTRRSMNEAAYDEVTGKVGAITNGFLAPLFFASIGLHLDLSALTSVPGFVILLVVVAIASKVIGAGLAARLAGLSPSESMVVGIGMSGRGAVELIVADIALRAGLFLHPDPPPPIVANMFSAVVIMAIVTTLMAPIALRLVLSPETANKAA